LYVGVVPVHYNDLRLGPIIIWKLVIWTRAVEKHVPLGQVANYADKLLRVCYAGPWSLESVVVGPFFDGNELIIADVAILTKLARIIEQF
jgi:hypothetical protein